MNKSEIISRLSRENQQLNSKIIEKAVNTLLEQISSSLEKGDRVEIRGFGSYNLRARAARKSRNPRTGVKLLTTEKKVALFRPAKSMRERVNHQRKKYSII